VTVDIPAVKLRAASIGLEFAVGVTGHRDLATEDAERTKEEIRTALSGLQRRFSHLSLRLMTGLAEGADTLAADVALELGIEVCAVLPMPLDIYCDDFSGPARERLFELCTNEKILVTALPLAGTHTASDMHNQAKRDLQYEQLRDFLIRRSNVMLALWDGKVGGPTGGTSDVIMSYLGNNAEFSPPEVQQNDLMASDCGNLVIWIPTRRAAHVGADIPRTVTHLVGSSSGDCYWRQNVMPAQVETRWTGLESYASDRYSSMGTTLPAYGLTGATVLPSHPEADALTAEFTRADQLARANQAQSDRMFKVFGVLAASMGFVFLVYAKIIAAQLLLFIYIALFLAGFAGFRISARQRWLGRHLAYRALAETLRIQYFLILSGANSDNRLRRILRLTNVDRFEGFEWLPDAVRCAEPATNFAGSDPDGQIVRTQWIEGQAGYFENKLHAMHKQHKVLGVVKAILLAGSIVGALLLILFKKALLHMEMAGTDGKIWLVFLMGLLPLWVAVWEVYQSKMAIRELIWQYSNQYQLFSKASMQLTAAPGIEAGRRVIRDLADRALMEIYLWSVHRYHREHEPPSAG
jgi:hypothetical protein